MMTMMAIVMGGKGFLVIRYAFSDGVIGEYLLS